MSPRTAHEAFAPGKTSPDPVDDEDTQDAADAAGDAAEEGAGDAAPNKGADEPDGPAAAASGSKRGDDDDDDDDDDDNDDDAAAASRTAGQRLIALGNKIVKGMTAPRDAINRVLADGTRRVSAVLPALPAANLGSLAVGLPHAHPAHPPFVPMSPLGPALIGFCIDVLINGAPALQAGALGFSPTCCGLSPLFEVITGSSSVLLSGERAVRTLDLTVHCMPAPISSHQTSGPMRPLQRGVQLAESAAHLIRRAADTSEVAQTYASAGRALVKAAKADSAPMREAARTAADMAVASPIADKVQAQLAQALTALMGRDPPAPAGTPGVILNGAGNVLIGGMPVPGSAPTARGLLRLLPARR
jgi:uncharacterized Zn-binding protein involved in type VI secretion